MLRLKAFFSRRKNKEPEVRGCAQWLAWAETKYGGFVADVPRDKVSPFDPRSEADLRRGSMIGGDRMTTKQHGYAKKYEQYLLPFIASRRSVIIAEVGILRGTGLAIWSELFPNGRVMGFDIDLEHIRRNMSNLRSKGAFTNKNLELYEFDQLVDNADYLSTIMGDSRFDIVIDDGLHSIESITKTLSSFSRFLAPDFVYIVEDRADVYGIINRLYPSHKIDSAGMLTILHT